MNNPERRFVWSPPEVMGKVKEAAAEKIAAGVFEGYREHPPKPKEANPLIYSRWVIYLTNYARTLIEYGGSSDCQERCAEKTLSFVAGDEYNWLPGWEHGKNVTRAIGEIGTHGICLRDFLYNTLLFYPSRDDKPQTFKGFLENLWLLDRGIYRGIYDDIKISKGKKEPWTHEHLIPVAIAAAETASFPEIWMAGIAHSMALLTQQIACGRPVVWGVDGTLREQDGYRFRTDPFLTKPYLLKTESERKAEERRKSLTEGSDRMGPRLVRLLIENGLVPAQKLLTDSCDGLDSFLSLCTKTRSTAEADIAEAREALLAIRGQIADASRQTGRVGPPSPLSRPWTFSEIEKVMEEARAANVNRPPLMILRPPWEKKK
ncbi:MAG: hypothetical protein Q8N98_03195 [bacterium]|nr:hypothetical protein [bacterium]